MSVRQLLNNFGVTRWNTFTEPLRNLSEAEVIALLLNWITRNMPNKELVLLCVRDPDQGDAYNLWLTNDRGCILTRGLLKSAKINEGLLYCWPPSTTPNDLTLEKLQHSIELADQINAQQIPRAQLSYPHSYQIASNTNYK